MNLNDLNEIKKLDKCKVLDSIEALDKQCQQAWEEVIKIDLKDDFSVINKVMVVGMGGSALGAEMIKAIYFTRLRVPFEIVRDYDLPDYADEKTLVLLSSYSGTTEEVLAAAREAVSKKAKIMAISAGGELEKIAKEKGWTYFKINAVHNPCGQPRMAIGYSVMGIIGLLAKAGVITTGTEEIEKVIKVIRDKQLINGVNNNQGNRAKELAVELKNKIILVLAGEHLSGNAKVFCNTLNENAKAIGTYFLIPEANHHLLEGLTNPPSNQDNLVFLVLTSSLYSQPIGKRFGVTKKVIAKNGIKVIEVKAMTEDKLSQAFEILTLGAYICFYLAMLYGIDPVTIPWVEFFKAEMKKDDSQNS